MQKEAIVVSASSGKAWRLASDEGPYLDGYDSAPCPLSFLTTGLVHYTDGPDGALKRINAALPSVPNFSIAAECGFGRRDPATIPELLELHLQAASQSPQ